MANAIIFDLDQTLIDSSSAEMYRKARNWQVVYSMIPKFVMYTGIREVLDEITSRGIKVCIITTSPGAYARKVINHFQIPCDHLIDFFAVSNRKPHPESFNLALKRLACTCDAVVSFGDRTIDIIASKASGIYAVACLWGSAEKDLLVSAAPDCTISHPEEILMVLKNLSEKLT